MPYTDLLPERAPNGQNVERFSFPIADVSIPETAQQMTDILDAIDHSLVSGHGVYVHCWGGVGRTGTVIGCWLKRHFQDGKIVRKRHSAPIRLGGLWKECPISAWKPNSPETLEQLYFIEEWHESHNPSNWSTNEIVALLKQLTG